MYIAALRNAEKRGKQENRRKELVVRSSVGKIMEASITEQIALNFYRRALFFHFTLSFFPPAPFVFFFFFRYFSICLSILQNKVAHDSSYTHAERIASFSDMYSSKRMNSHLRINVSKSNIFFRSPRQDLCVSRGLISASSLKISVSFIAFECVNQ